MSRFEKHIFVCTNQRSANNPRSCCAAKGGADIRLALVNALARHGLKGAMRANKTGCLNACELGPAVVIYPQGLWYLEVTEADVEEIVETSILGDGVVDRLAATPERWERLRQLRRCEDAKK